MVIKEFLTSGVRIINNAFTKGMTRNKIRNKDNMIILNHTTTEYKSFGDIEDIVLNPAMKKFRIHRGKNTSSEEVEDDGGITFKIIF